MERDRKRKGYTEWREYVNQEGTVVGLIETILKFLFFPFFSIFMQDHKLPKFLTPTQELPRDFAPRARKKREVSRWRETHREKPRLNEIRVFFYIFHVVLRIISSPNSPPRSFRATSHPGPPTSATLDPLKGPQTLRQYRASLQQKLLDLYLIYLTFLLPILHL